MQHERKHERKSVAASILTALAVVALVTVLLGTYFGAYLWLGEEKEMYAVKGNPSLKSSIQGPGMQVVSVRRSYRNGCLVTIFRPAARLEGALRGCRVTTALYEVLAPIDLGASEVFRTVRHHAMTFRSSTAAPILAVLAIVLAVLGAYVGGYFWLGERIDWAANMRKAPPVFTHSGGWSKL